MKNSNHASKALAVVLSGALAFAPAANAALDESNMAYDSAAEGFYGSLRVQYANNDKARKINGIQVASEDNDSSVDADLSRLGVRGDVDLGGGLEAFYGFEWNLGSPANGADDLNTRQHHVGLKGDWGSVWLGAFDSVIVRFGGFGTTDILDQYSGNFEPFYRTSNAIAYISPDLNGFQFGIEVAANDGNGEADPTGLVGVIREDRLTGANPLTDTGTLETERRALKADDGNDFDNIGVGVGYSIQGLSFSGAYLQEQDGLGAGSDKGQYALGIGYSQDNWIVAAMYGGRDVSKSIDANFLSLAAGVSIDKLEVHGLWEQDSYEALGVDVNDTVAAISARYHLGSKARVRAAWQNRESEVGPLSVDSTKYALGMQVDF